MATAGDEDEELASESPLLEEGRLEPGTDQGQAVSGGSNRALKVISLLLLTPQYAVLILLMRYVRTRPGPMFLTSTTVLLAEVTKMVTCLAIIFVQQGGFRKWAEHLHDFLISKPREFLKVCLPSFLFVLQNNLVFVAISNLDAATFQVTYQLKILTTAIFSVVMLGKRLSVAQWLSLLLLFAGVSVIQVKLAMAQSSNAKLSPISPLNRKIQYFQPLAATAESTAKRLSVGTVVSTTSAEEEEASPPSSSASGDRDTAHQNHFTGLMAVLACCVLSGFANVFFELLLKGGKQSVWIRNVQLGLSGAVLSALTCLAHDGRQLREQGFLFGYDELVWTVILLQSLGGLLVAAVIKYADNILKGFSTAGSILLSCVASIYIFDFQMDSIFILGTTLVLLSLYLYNLFPAVQPVPDTKELHVTPDNSANKNNIHVITEK